MAKYRERCQYVQETTSSSCRRILERSIHRLACSALGAGRSSNEHFVPVWAGRMIEPLPVRVVIEATDRRGLLADCAVVVADATECFGGVDKVIRGRRLLTTWLK